ELLEVQDEVGDVLLDARHGGELVQDAVDADAGDSRTGNGRQQGAAERVAEGVAEAGLERLQDEPRAVLADRLLGEGRALCDEQGIAPSMSSPRYMRLGRCPGLQRTGSCCLAFAC